MVSNAPMVADVPDRPSIFVDFSGAGLDGPRRKAPSTAGSMECQSRRAPTAAPSKCIDSIRGWLLARVANASAAATMTLAPRLKPTSTTERRSARTIASASTAPVIDARVLATCHGFLARPAAVNAALNGPSSMLEPFAAWTANAAMACCESCVAPGATSAVRDLSSFAPHVSRYTVACG